MTSEIEQTTEGPKGLLKLFFKLPVLAYRTGTGFLLGSRFIYVEHIGRKSGKIRRSVLEVIRYDKENDVYYIASGYGEKSDWYKNIRKNPRVKIQVGFRKATAEVEFLNEMRSEEEIRDYEKRHPTAIRQLSKLTGIEVNWDDADLAELSKLWPVLAFYPN